MERRQFSLLRLCLDQILARYREGAIDIAEAARLINESSAPFDVARRLLCTTSSCSASQLLITSSELSLE